MKNIKSSCSAILLAASLFLTVAAYNAPASIAQRQRVGAICNDGTQSDATGSGACSHHGGVKCWMYDDGTCTNP
jgi:hypothetical protein